MQFTEKLNIPGAHDFTFLGQAGLLEAQLVVPNNINSDNMQYVALIGV